MDIKIRENHAHASYVNHLTETIIEQKKKESNYYKITIYKGYRNYLQRKNGLVIYSVKPH